MERQDSTAFHLGALEVYQLVHFGLEHAGKLFSEVDRANYRELDREMVGEPAGGLDGRLAGEEAAKGENGENGPRLDGEMHFECLDRMKL